MRTLLTSKSARSLSFNDYSEFQKLVFLASQREQGLSARNLKILLQKGGLFSREGVRQPTLSRLTLSNGAPISHLLKAVEESRMRKKCILPPASWSAPMSPGLAISTSSKHFGRISRSILSGKINIKSLVIPSPNNTAPAQLAP